MKLKLQVQLLNFIQIESSFFSQVRPIKMSIGYYSSYIFLDVNSGRDDKKYKTGTPIEVRIAYHICVCNIHVVPNLFICMCLQKKVYYCIENCGINFIVLSLKLTKLFLYYVVCKAGNAKSIKSQQPMHVNVL